MTGIVKIETPEQLEAIATAAKNTRDAALLALRDVMTPERCAEVRELRCGEDGGTWRYVAEVCHERWGASWSPPSNQIWGMALCSIAAEHFGESAGDAPWN